MLLSFRCLVLFSALLAQLKASVDHAPPRVQVDLDEAPEHRWDHVVAARKDTYLRSFESVFAAPQVQRLLPLAKPLLGNEFVARRLLPGDLYGEAKGIARGLGLDVALIVLGSIFYDLFAAGNGGKLGRMKACTGVVAQSASGEIIHGRNLDYAFRDALANATTVVDFVRGGKIVFTAVTFGPLPTFNTAVRYGSFSLSHDQRMEGRLSENLWDMFLRGRPSVFTRIRQAMETLPTYEQAVKEFSTVDLAAPSYFILGGMKPGEGAVITRDRDASSLHDVWKLNASAGGWYVLETNYDHSKPVTNPHDNRRVVLQRTLNAIGPAGISVSSMWEVISTTDANRSAGERPPYNNMTIYRDRKSVV